MALPQSDYITEAEYLALERASEVKHEYAAGEVIAMTGATWQHNAIVGNVITALNTHLRETPCIVNASDMRVRVDAAHSYRYPDVSVVCEPPQIEGEAPGWLVNPVVLIEVLSATTQVIDREAKLREYTQIPSLQAYLLITQENPRVERYLRGDDPNWLYTDGAGLEAAIEIPPLGCTLSLADVYLKIAFERGAK